MLINRKLALGLATWKQLIEPKDDPMARALKHLLNRELSRGWKGWHTQWVEAARKREAMKRSLKHMFNRELSRGFGAWVLMADERRERMKIMRKGLSILKDGEMLRGFLS